LPDYLHDLNAMHEAALNLGPDLGSEYAVRLRAIVHADATPEMLRSDSMTKWCSDLYFYEATAAQRAEALLRTIGKWETKP
jgi:hypothetical protein